MLLTPSRSVNHWVKSLTIEKLFGSRDIHIEFLDKPFITGPSGFGKSSVLKLLEFATNSCRGFITPFAFRLHDGALPYFDKIVVETFGDSVSFEVDHDARILRVRVASTGYVRGVSYTERSCLGKDENLNILGDECHVSFLDIGTGLFASLGSDERVVSFFEKTLKKAESFVDWDLANAIYNVPNMWGDKTNLWDYAWPSEHCKVEPLLRRHESDMSLSDILGTDKPSRSQIIMLWLSLFMSCRDSILIVDDIDAFMHLNTQRQFPNLLRLAYSRGLQVIASTNSFHLMPDENLDYSTDLYGLTVNPAIAYDFIETYNIVPLIPTKQKIASRILSAKPGEVIHECGFRLGRCVDKMTYVLLGGRKLKLGGYDQESLARLAEAVEDTIDFINDPKNMIIKV